MAITRDGAALVFADDANGDHDIRVAEIATKQVLTIGKLQAPTTFGSKAGFATFGVGNRGGTYIADGKANRIKQVKFNAATSVFTIPDLAGDGTAESKDGPQSEARFHKPEAIAASRAGDKIYVADNGSHTIRMLEYK